LRDEGATIILSTHNMNSVEELCDDIALLNRSNVVIQGSVKDLREQYRNATYRMSFTGNMLAFTNALWTNYELLDKTSEEHTHEVVVRILGERTLNDLLNTVLPEVQVHGVQEIIPSMNDIFIQAVSGNEAENETPENRAS
jgi:ABC-2 type transport system ATP-binding protein